VGPYKCLKLFTSCNFKIIFNYCIWKENKIWWWCIHKKIAKRLIEMLNQMQKPKFYYIFIEKNKEAKLVMW